MKQTIRKDNQEKKHISKNTQFLVFHSIFLGVHLTSLEFLCVKRAFVPRKAVSLASFSEKDAHSSTTAPRMQLDQ